MNTVPMRGARGEVFGKLLALGAEAQKWVGAKYRASVVGWTRVADFACGDTPTEAWRALEKQVAMQLTPHDEETRTLLEQ